MQWLIGATGVVAFATGVAAFGYAFVFKPERLRTEEMARMDMMLDWLTRPDVDDDHRSAAAKLLPIVMQPKQGKAQITTSLREDDHG